MLVLNLNRGYSQAAWSNIGSLLLNSGNDCDTSFAGFNVDSHFGPECVCLLVVCRYSFVNPVLHDRCNREKIY